MATLETTIDGLKLPNPFIIGSGPPGTNANVIGKAFDEVESIDHGTAVVEISGSEISRLVGMTVVLEPGQARVRVGGTLVPVSARIEGSTLVVEAGGLSLPAIEIPPLPLVSCVSGTEILAGRLRLTCDVDQVPVELAGRSVRL